MSSSELVLVGGSVTLVSSQDFDRLSVYRWYCRYGEDPRRVEVFRIGVPHTGEPSRVILSRQIMNPEQGMEVDHINHDRRDNRRENLRVCTRAENGRNRLKFKNNTSGVKGVCWDARCKRWQVNITLNWKQRFLGRYASKEAAADAYARAAKEFHGEFHCIG